MKLKIDENLPDEIAVELRASGHDAETMFDETMAGAADAAIMARARAEGRAVVTMDKGIADIRAYPPDQYAGIILLRPASTGRNAVLSFARQHLPGLLAVDLTGRLFVVTESGIRSR